MIAKNLKRRGVALPNHQRAFFSVALRAVWQ